MHPANPARSNNGLLRRRLRRVLSLSPQELKKGDFMGENILTKELLLRSVEDWNKARIANPGYKPNLYGADLRRADLFSVNLLEAELRGADLSEANLQWADLRNADLRGAYLYRVNLSESNLCGVDLSLSSLKRGGYGVLGTANLDGIYGTNLTGANLHAAFMPGANLNAAHLQGADLSDALLSGTNLSGTNFVDADLSRAHLHRADLQGAILTRAKLIDADLSWAEIKGAILSEANFSRAAVDNTTFGAVDLSSVIGLDTLRHKGPSTIGIDTIYASKGNIPEVFLRGCGVPDSFITYARSLTANPIDFYSCFISYSTKDDDFARRIHNDLQASGVRCWFAPHDIQGGKKVLHQIEEAIRLYDKLLLILSPDSMNSNWVETEIINAIKKEQQQQKQMLFPISIVPFEQIKKWKRFDSDSGRDLAREIREYHIPDFSLWGSDQSAYKTAFERLLKDLKQ